jgi:transcriptional regulator with XRE-family HTH domain
MQKVDLHRIKILRVDKKITQKYMAEKLGYKSDIGYHYLETGRCQIKAEQLAIIADVLEVKIEELYVKNTTDKVGLECKDLLNLPTGAK